MPLGRRTPFGARSPRRTAAYAAAGLAVLAAGAAGAPERGETRAGAVRSNAGAARATAGSDALGTLPDLHAAARGGAAAALEIPGVPLGNGATGTLELRRFTNLAPGAQVIAVHAGGREIPVETGVTLYRGSLAGEPGSLAVVGVSPHGTHGFIRRAERGTLVISSGPQGAGLPAVVSRFAATAPPVGEDFCDLSDPRVTHEMMAEAVEAAPLGRRSNAETGACRIVDVAVDTDVEFTWRLFQGNTTASAAYIQTLFAAASEIYRRDVGAELRLTYVRVWAADEDPYGRLPDTASFLSAMRSWWNENETHIERDVVHALSGRSLGGGRAYLNALCSQWNGYGVSGNMRGFFPTPTQSHHADNWDLYVVAHELGHNFGTHHTHDTATYNPVVDGCGLGDCSDAYGGTIMSYCHQCTGGIANIDLRFHPRVIDRIRGYLATVDWCLDRGEGIAAADDTAHVARGASVAIDVLANDRLEACDGGLAGEAAGVTSVDPVSDAGGSVTLLPDGRILYTAPEGFDGSDAFRYRIGFGGLDAAEGVVRLYCPSDLGRDGSTDVDDLLAFLGLFRVSSPAADADGDGLVTVNDLLSYLGAFRGGC